MSDQRNPEPDIVVVIHEPDEPHPLQSLVDDVCREKYPDKQPPTISYPSSADILAAASDVWGPLVEGDLTILFPLPNGPVGEEPFSGIPVGTPLRQVREFHDRSRYKTAGLLRPMPEAAALDDKYSAMVERVVTEVMHKLQRGPVDLTVGGRTVATFGVPAELIGEPSGGRMGESQLKKLYPIWKAKENATAAMREILKMESSDDVIDWAVALAIQSARGEFTTMGPIGCFECGCCRKVKTNPEYVGGVWTAEPDRRHVLVCNACVELFADKGV